MNDPNNPGKVYNTEAGLVVKKEEAVERPKPIRKPDPSVRELRRQISFGSGSGGLPSLGSIKKRATIEEPVAATVHPPPPVVEEDGPSTTAIPSDGKGGARDEGASAMSPGKQFIPATKCII